MSKNLNLSVSQAESFCSSSFYGNKFDIIVLSHVIEHILDHKSFFIDLDNALNNESLIYIEVPDLENFDLSDDQTMMVDQREPMLQFNTEHINFYTKQTLWKMMDRLGYMTIEIDQVTSGISVLAGLFKKKASGSTYVYRYLEQCEKVYKIINLKLSDYFGEPVYIWGAGGHTQRCLIHTKMKLLNVKAFIDNDESLYGGILFGKPIVSPAELSENYPIIISSLLYVDEISTQISKMNLKNKVVKLYEG